MKKKQTALARKLNKTGLLLCIPAMLIVVFAVYALGYALVMSFNSNKAIMAGTYNFIGWNNYIKVFTNKDIRAAVGNTLLYAVCTICIELVIGLVVSAALRKNVRGSGIAKVCIILPMMMAPIASGTIWRWMLTDRYGIINHLLSFLNIQGPIWLADKIAAKAAVLMVSIWTAAPFVILVLLAAISGISDDIIEAARIDGAGDLQAYWYIIFPHLKSAVAVILLIRIPDALKMYDIVYILTEGGPANSTQVISYYIYNRGFTTLKFGEAAAASFLLFVFIAFFSVIANKLIQRKG
ncbi:MAG: sugar ABC transporter permease [Lachnospiraceae bacterium]|nr:sugar ABC transporter permease [Lachnospiraceae bacterium]